MEKVTHLNAEAFRWPFMNVSKIKRKIIWQKTRECFSQYGQSFAANISKPLISNESQLMKFILHLKFKRRTTTNKITLSNNNHFTLIMGVISTMKKFHTIENVLVEENEEEEEKKINENNKEQQFQCIGIYCMRSFTFIPLFPIMLLFPSVGRPQMFHELPCNSNEKNRIRERSSTRERDQKPPLTILI